MCACVYMRVSLTALRCQTEPTSKVWVGSWSREQDSVGAQPVSESLWGQILSLHSAAFPLLVSLQAGEWLINTFYCKPRLNIGLTSSVILRIDGLIIQSTSLREIGLMSFSFQCRCSFFSLSLVSETRMP